MVKAHRRVNPIPAAAVTAVAQPHHVNIDVQQQQKVTMLASSPPSAAADDRGNTIQDDIDGVTCLME